MKRMIVGLLAVLMVASAGAARAENAIADKHQNKSLLGTYNDGGTLITINMRVNSSGHQVVDAGPNTFTVAGPQLEAIKVAAQAIEGIGNTQLAELLIHTLELGAIEGNGNTILAELEVQTLQLGVIEGNGTTLNVTAATIDAGVTAINTELDGQTLQLGVIEGNGTTGTAHLAAIETAIEGTGASAQETQGTAADGAPAAGNPNVGGGVDGSANAQAWLSDTDGHQQIDVVSSALGAGAATSALQDTQILQLGVIEGNGTTGTASLAAIEAEQLIQSFQLGVIEGNGTTLNATATATELNTDTGTAIDTATVTIGNSATQIVAASATRRKITIINAFTDLVAIGFDNTVTLNSVDATDGWILGVSNAASDGTGGSKDIETTSAIWAIGASASSEIIYMTESD